MSTVVIIGAQWGDEGKGKIVDFLAEQADVVVRYQGGNNAGHTVTVGDQQYKLHLIPSGILYPEKLCLVGNGLVIDPEALLTEMDYLRERGVGLDNLRISDRAHVLMPYHRRLDELEEDRRGENKIGTTRKGIGPAYVDKAARIGIRMVDLLDSETFHEKLANLLPQKNEILVKVYGSEAMDYQSMVEQYDQFANRIRPYVADTSVLLHEQVARQKKVLFEGAQGTLLDIDYGTYPYVTSSHPVSGGVCIGAGIGPTQITRAVGVVKAYSTRVGDGPFVTELQDETGDYIRNKGSEFGTTTGRPRRCGWLDAVVVRYAKRMNGLESMALTRLDILGGLPKLKICTGYRLNGQPINELPASLKLLAHCQPVYEEMDGWTEDISRCGSYDQLPAAAKAYVQRICEVTDLPASIVSVGPKRHETFILKSLF